MQQIVGMDYSINSPGCVKFLVNEVLEITDISYIGFSSVKKIVALDKNIIYYHKNQFLNQFEKYYWFRDKCLEFMSLTEKSYVGIEDYAFGATGRVFSIAESTFAIKSQIYNSGAVLRTYPPTLIKKFSTGKGNANKRDMFVSFYGTPDTSLLQHLSEGSPQEDLIDAYFVAKMLLNELKVRRGIIPLSSLTPKQIECFNATSKSHPDNILMRDFIQKEN